MKHMVNNQMVGFDESNDYIDKKGITAEEAMNPNTRYNELPPGQNIDDQRHADINMLPFKQITPLGFPGDGWTGD